MKIHQENSTRLIASVILALVFTAYLNTVHASEQAKNISKVNGSIEVNQLLSANNVSTVNGSIRISEGVSASAVSTVNGSVRVNDGSSIRSAETVNGSILLGEDVTVRESLHTVNGSIRAHDDSQVGKNISTVNGTVELRSVTVDGNIKTSNGSIRLLDGSIVKGDVVIEKRSPRWWSFGFNFGRSNNQTLEIGADSRVEGTVHLYREVKLEVDERARVNKIEHHY